MQMCGPCLVILRPAKNPKVAVAKADAIPPPKPPAKPSVPDPKGLAAPPAPPKAETLGVPAPKFPPRAKSKAKSKARSISDAEKAKIPCIFHRIPNGCMHGRNCKYSHEDPKSGSIPKGKPKGKDAPPKGKGGPLAKALVASVAAASLCKLAAGSGPEYSAQWAADKAAGRHLGSHQALLWNKGFLRQRFSPAFVRRMILLPLALAEGRNLAFKRFP